ncbi:ubiquitin carboxyl-terminal hydrolase 5 [Orussus abietinus]|uniref:ubiquitin carboxyl-terminal hydrolase 5 n=1 Tax=Orussus abietinus TaxID=222816 RepID=UPI000625CBF4|nr:ubiquitin carboxyl-terminal hydrolase 5 [Orussus abietinus]
MEILRQHLDKVEVPKAGDKVYKDECIFSFDTPESPLGLFISLKTFLGVGAEYLELYYNKTKDPVYLRIKQTKKEIPTDQQDESNKVTKLAIGITGGFMPNQKKYTYEEEYAIIVFLPPTTVELTYPNGDLPEQVNIAVKSILEAESASRLAEKEALAETWDGEARFITKYAEILVQLDNGKKIPPSGWKCERCGITNNLWLNLSDGSILCGRKYFDGTGGNGHAIEHYQTTDYPLAVKLGTITKEGRADVFSYPENEMVEDPYLARHLMHWGINIAQMEKTEKSMIELELDLNQKFGEWVALQETGSKLTPIYGPGYTGLTNLGNSCYLNSVMQMIFTIPEFIKRYVDNASDIINKCVYNAADDFNAQMAKLGVGLLSGKYSVPPPENSKEYSCPGISPRMFKTLIGRRHPGFSSNRQQDAHEFFLHVINLLDRNSRDWPNPAECFKFKVEERYQCCGSNKVKYTYRPEYSLPIPIPLDAAVNKDELAAYEAKIKEAEARGVKLDTEAKVRPRINLASCLDAFSRTEIIEQFYSTALNEKTTALKTTRLASFPDYILIHLKKFTIREDWQPMKLDVSVDMPDLLDLSALRGTGLKPEEELLPEANDSEVPAPIYNKALLAFLMDMGFPLESCKRALYFTANRGLEPATTWLMDHITDSDFAERFVPPGICSNTDSSAFVPNPDAVNMVMAMGFTKEQATKALKETDNNLERAADWIFSHQSELNAMDTEEEHVEPPFRDGSGKYKLAGFISHMGTSTMVGHYVCHLLKENHWVIYNDEKVALSEHPPKELGYIYLYQRVE